MNIIEYINGLSYEDKNLNYNKIVIYLKGKIAFTCKIDEIEKELNISKTTISLLCRRLPYFVKNKEFITLRVKLEKENIPWLKQQNKYKKSLKEKIWQELIINNNLEYSYFEMIYPGLCTKNNFYEEKKLFNHWYNFLNK